MEGRQGEIKGETEKGINEMIEVLESIASKDREFRSFLEEMDFDPSDLDKESSVADFARYITSYPYYPGLFTVKQFLAAWNQYV